MPMVPLSLFWKETNSSLKKDVAMMTNLDFSSGDSFEVCSFEAKTSPRSEASGGRKQNSETMFKLDKLSGDEFDLKIAGTETSFERDTKKFCTSW